MSDLAFVRTLARDIRDYRSAAKKFSADRISEEEFDVSFGKVAATLARPDVASFFSASQQRVLEQPGIANGKTRMLAADLEQVVDFEAGLLAPMFGSKNATAKHIKKGLEEAPENYPAKPVAVSAKFEAAHEKAKELIKKSRTKNKREKKADKKLATFSVKMLIGVGCVATNALYFPALMYVSGAAGFTIIVAATKRLDI